MDTMLAASQPNFLVSQLKGVKLLYWNHSHSGSVVHLRLHYSSVNPVWDKPV